MPCQILKSASSFVRMIALEFTLVAGKNFLLSSHGLLAGLSATTLFFLFNVHKFNIGNLLFFCEDIGNLLDNSHYMGFFCGSQYGLLENNNEFPLFIRYKK